MRLTASLKIAAVALVLGAAAQNAAAEERAPNLAIKGTKTLEYGNTLCAENNGQTTCCTTSGDHSYCKTAPTASAQRKHGPNIPGKTGTATSASKSK